ncbi:MAG: ferrous iron transport protein A [Clostridia bacterium]|nr:ferrous iron transport protein A [Clostridia bacterium]
MVKYIHLNELETGCRARVVSVGGAEAIRQRFEDLGIVQGTEILCVMISPLGDPVAYLIRGALIAIRREDSANILAELCSEAQNGTDS